MFLGVGLLYLGLFLFGLSLKKVEGTNYEELTGWFVITLSVSVDCFWTPVDVGVVK